jgi:X-Pro dipeptidyl-peptidase (S15 family)
MRGYRGLLAALAVVLSLAIASSAQAAPITSVYGGTIECKAQVSKGNVRLCGGFSGNPADSANTFTLTWDGATKIDVNVILPPASGGTEGPYPLIGDFHGWGGSKQGLSTVEPGTGLTFEQEDPRIQKWAEEGYAVFSMSDRGWGLSCGKHDPAAETTPRQASCTKGYNHLMDDRYEVRDAQFLMSELAEEGVIQPKKIGVTGASYGGGISLALASLRNREMLTNSELVPWETESGEEMEIAAAVPQWPWSDLAYALDPNGRNLDYVTDSPYKGPAGKLPNGVWKASWSKALNFAGEQLSTYEPKDPEADIPGWLLRLEAGDPYSDASINAIIEQLSTFHSSFGINHAEAPSPLLIQSGWNDDLFPVDEALRYYERTRAQYPGDPISLYLADIGHARSQNKAADMAAFNVRLNAWFAHYLKGEGASPSSSVEALTTTCPSSAASEGPFKAADWSGLQPGEIRLQSAASQTITHGTPAEEEVPTASSGTFDPILGAKNPCVTLPEAAVNNPHAVDYSLGAAPAGGFTLMGSPTIIANVESASPNSQIAARLLDVSPQGEERLVARGLYRPVGGTQEMVFQLHPQGYHFAAGDVARLELLPSDLPYGRFSNLQGDVTVSNLELRLPVMEQPGALGGLVQTPAPKVVPAGYTLAAEFQIKPSGGGGGTSGSGVKPAPPVATIKIGVGSIAGKLTANGKAILVPLSCGGEGACSGKASFTVKKKGKKGRAIVAQGSYSIAAGKKATVQLPLTKAGRNAINGNQSKSLNGQFVLDDAGRPTSLTSQRAVQLPRAR